MSGRVGTTLSPLIESINLCARPGQDRSDRVVSAGFVSGCERTDRQLEAQALGLLPINGYYALLAMVMNAARTPA